MFDEYLEKFGLKYEDLNELERETFSSWSSALRSNTITVERVRDYITSMRQSVDAELAVSDLGKKKDILLKARLRNYILLEAFLSTPEKAKAALERAVAGIVPKK